MNEFDTSLKIVKNFKKNVKFGLQEISIWRSVFFVMRSSDGHATAKQLFGNRTINRKFADNFAFSLKLYKCTDILLQNLLLTLWNQGIDTIACCTGHEEDESNPYFSQGYYRAQKSLL